MWPARSSLVINISGVLTSKTPSLVLIQKPCDSLYLQFLVEPKDPDFVAFKQLQTFNRSLTVETRAFLKALHHGL